VDSGGGSPFSSGLIAISIGSNFTQYGAVGFAQYADIGTAKPLGHATLINVPYVSPAESRGASFPLCRESHLRGSP
jgi:hypothetical protein